MWHDSVSTWAILSRRGHRWTFSDWRTSCPSPTLGQYWLRHQTIYNRVVPVHALCPVSVHQPRGNIGISGRSLFRIAKPDHPSRALWYVITTLIPTGIELKLLTLFVFHHLFPQVIIRSPGAGLKILITTSLTQLTGIKPQIFDALGKSMLMTEAKN